MANCLTAMVDRTITGAEADQASGQVASRAAKNITLKRLSPESSTPDFPLIPLQISSNWTLILIVVRASFHRSTVSFVA